LARLFILTILLAFVSGLGCTTNKAEQEADAKRVTVDSKHDATKDVVDEDYRFRLRWPGEGWKLMNEDEVRHLQPDSVAGVVSSDSALFCVVIAEPLPGSDLASYSDLIVDQLAVTDKKVHSHDDIEFAGRPARRFVADGTIDGMLMRFIGTLFLNQDFAYQIMCWSSNPKISVNDLEPALDAFEILPGEVKGRRSTVTTRDTSGPGWRVKDGRFESALTGIGVQPTEGWRVVVGAELTTMSEDAEVGLSHRQPDIYAVVITESTPKEGAEQLLQTVRQQLLDDTPAVGEIRSVQLDFWGKPRTFTQFQSNMPFEFNHIAFNERGMTVQVLGWYATGTREAALVELQKGLSSVTLASEEERKRLEEELLAVPDQQNAVGPTYSLRRGVYRDFGNGVVWRRPRGFWRIITGDEARSRNADAALWLEEPRLGLYGVVIVEDVIAQSPAEYHDAVIANMRAAGNMDLRPSPGMTIGGLPAQGTEGPSQIDGLLLHHRAATQVRGNKALQVMFWGTREDMEKGRATTEAVTTGFQFKPGLQPVEKRPGRYVDHRMGFSLKPPAGLDFKDHTPGNLQSVGTVVAWEGKSRAVVVMALCGLAEGQDEQWFSAFVEQIAKEQFGKLMRDAPERTKTTVQGIEASHLTYTNLLERADLITFTRDRTLYSLITVGKGKDTLEQTLPTFKLVD
jgi:hypothetical protein